MSKSDRQYIELDLSSIGLDEIRTKIYELWVQTNDEDDPFCSQLRLADIMGFNASELRKWINCK